MGNTHEQAVKTIEGIDGYKTQFAAVFPQDGITIDTIAKAMGFPWEQYPYRAPYNSSSDSLLIKNRPRRERFL